jgi:hypothetical protein
MKLEEIKNHGLIIPEIVEGDHYVLGGYSKIKGEVINPKGSYRAWLPIKEFQNIRGIETQSCTCFATNNALETLINFKFGIQANYSDRALAIASDINPYIGGDPHNVAECIRKYFGAVDEAILPFSDDIKSPDDYIKPKPLPKEIISKGAEWIDNWEFFHQWVFAKGISIEDKHKALKEALTKGTVCVSVTAWIYDNDNNVYTKPIDGLDTHWCQLFEYDEEGYPIVFDSYDGFIKKLSKTYDFNIAKVYYLNKRENKINPILQAIINIIKKILDIDQEIINKNVLVKPVVPIIDTSPIKLPEKEMKPKYIWDNPKDARHSVRVICDEEGLSVADKNVLCACVQVESGFNPKAVGENKDKTGKVWSRDWGIVQINDYYHVGNGPDKSFPSTQYILDNPEECVRWMCKLWKQGKQHLWASYNSGAYKKYL